MNIFCPNGLAAALEMANAVRKIARNRIYNLRYYERIGAVDPLKRHIYDAEVRLARGKLDKANRMCRALRRVIRGLHGSGINWFLFDEERKRWRLEYEAATRRSRP